MMSCGTILCGVPAACWQTRESKNGPAEFLRRFFGEMETLERRLQKEVAFDEESRRYSRLCRQIERVALGNAAFAPTASTFRRSLRQGAFPAMRVGSAYVDLIRLLQLSGEQLGIGSRGRLGATIFSPQQLRQHVAEFCKAAKARDYLNHPAIAHRVWFLRKRVLPAGCGLVECPDALSPMWTDDVAPTDAVDGRSLWQRFWAWMFPTPAIETTAEQRRSQFCGVVEPPQATDWQRYGEVEDRGDFMNDRLRRQIEQAMRPNERAEPVNLMSQRQNMATQILQEFIHKRKGHPPVDAALTYSDGAQVRPFPLRCLPRLPDGWFPTREFHFGLVSMRHLPIDQYVDMNWYRNVEVPSVAGLSGADEFCFQFSCKQLSELLAANRSHRLRLHIYHTGYMPAVIGFYRALVVTLASAQQPLGCLQVLPKLQPDKNGGFLAGRPWPE